MTPLQERGVENDVDELIDRYATTFDDDGFIAALEIMIDYAKTAKQAREEEIEDE